jgi:hypothetical protein
MRVFRFGLLCVCGTALGCFSSSSSSSGRRDAALGNDGETAVPDASVGAPIPDSSLTGTAPDSGLTSDASDAGAMANVDASRTCSASTCSSVKVIFEGWIAGGDGGPEAVQIAVDQGTPDGGVNGTVVKTASVGAPSPANENLLVGDFVTTGDAGTLLSPLEYANNACDVPDFAGRTNAYYLAPMQGLPVDPSWYKPQCGCGGTCGPPCIDGGSGGACDFQSEFYSQTCPNFGGNCVVTPLKIESIQVIATVADTTCKVCLYDSTAPSASTILKCVSPGAVLSGTDLYGTGADASASEPLLLRLDDGSGCASY